MAIFRYAVLVAALVTAIAQPHAWAAQNPAPADPPSAPTPPASGYVLHDERTVDRFTVQRWVNAAMPDVSPAGFCDCITLVYDGARLVLDLGMDAGITRVASSVADITGDSRPELVVTSYTGGAHCCESTTIYSIEEKPREILSVSTGNCQGGLEDLDGDAIPEFHTCDDVFAYEFCAFAFSPLPPVVFAYDPAARLFRLATPRYEPFFAARRERDLEMARERIAESGNEPEIARCAALAPALTLAYQGRVEEGRQLFRSLYSGADTQAIEDKAFATARASSLWTEG